ncbi:hypothetical protein Gohar_021937, partial [Gossypium harknessii]|nr:hypothetical protein [Gossypium harknessii]
MAKVGTGGVIRGPSEGWLVVFKMSTGIGLKLSGSRSSKVRLELRVRTDNSPLYVLGLLEEEVRPSLMEMDRRR